MAQKRPKRCPNCGGPTKWKGNPYRPFCSERCRMIDLGQWAMERYRIAGEKGATGQSGETGKVEEK